MTNKLDSLTGFRALLAGMVLLAHSFHRIGLLDNNCWWTHFCSQLGHFGVIGFFVLSGFILRVVYEDRMWSVKEFVGNRLARIYPLYFVGLVFTFAIDWYSPGFATGNKVEALVLNVVGLQSWFDFANGRFNGPGWTLSVEAFFYACFPLLYILQNRSKLFFIMLGLGLLVVSAVVWNPNVFVFSYRFPLWRLWEFVLGMVAASLMHRFRNQCKFNCEFALVIFFVGAVLSSTIIKSTPWHFFGWSFMALCCVFSIMIFASCDHRGSKNQLLAGRFWVLAGEISYGVYLFHDGIQRYSKVVLEKIMGRNLEVLSFLVKLIYILGTSIATIFLAYFLWKYLEMPARIMLRKAFSRKRNDWEHIENLGATVIYYNNLVGDTGMPGVTKKLLADLSVSGGNFYGCDFKNFFRIHRGENNKLEMILVGRADVGRIEHGIFVAWNPPVRQLLAMITLKLRGERLSCWTCGYFAHQQWEANWEGGGMPLSLKKAVIVAMRNLNCCLVDHFLVAGEVEILDSSLPPKKCVQGCFGRVDSAVMDKLDSDDQPLQDNDLSVEKIVFIGRGLWDKKGICHVVRWAQKSRNKLLNFVFLVTAKDAKTQEEFISNSYENCEWHDDVRGVEMIPWLRNAAAVVSLSSNPTQLRGLYEALYAGVPIVVSREAFMDGFREIFVQQGLDNAVQIISSDAIRSGEVDLRVMNLDQRAQIASIMRVILSKTCYVDWLNDWCVSPCSPVSYYKHVCDKLK